MKSGKSFMPCFSCFTEQASQPKSSTLFYFDMQNTLRLHIRTQNSCVTFAKAPLDLKFCWSGKDFSIRSILNGNRSHKSLKISLIYFWMFCKHLGNATSIKRLCNCAPSIEARAQNARTFWGTVAIPNTPGLHGAGQ